MSKPKDKTGVRFSHEVNFAASYASRSLEQPQNLYPALGTLPLTLNLAGTVIAVPLEAGQCLFRHQLTWLIMISDSCLV